MTTSGPNAAPEETKGKIDSAAAISATEVSTRSNVQTASSAPDKTVVTADTSANGAGPPPTVAAPPQVDAPEKKKHPLTWERTIEIAKLLATIWVAFVGSYVTMQFNERQHELNRIEAIAKMLPHVASKNVVVDDSDSDDSTPAAVPVSSIKLTGGADEKAAIGKTKKAVAVVPKDNSSPLEETHDMGRDGAIWAIFRTANNRVMLRDLASLFPQDIYRVVSSIAIAGELDHDNDAVTALQVASEKLAAQYSTDPRHAEVAGRLYAQALRLKERNPKDESPLHVIDLSTDLIEATTSDEHVARLVKSVNDLADLHMREGENAVKKASAAHWQAKDLYKRARQIGINSKDKQVLIQVIRADLGLAEIYLTEHVLGDALQYVKEAHALEHQVSSLIDKNDPLKALDTDGDGFATQPEIANALQTARAELIQIEKDHPHRGVSLN